MEWGNKRTSEKRRERGRREGRAEPKRKRR